MSIGQSLWVRRQLEWERNNKEKMIHSVMPPQVADWLMKETVAEDSEDGGQDREDGAILKAVSFHQLPDFCDIFLYVSPLHSTTFLIANLSLFNVFIS